jgi:predicted amidohydrolase YtcJ
MKALIYLIFSVFLMASCKNRVPEEKGDTVYFGGTILTMEDTAPQVEAVVSKNGKILFTGAKSDADHYTDDKTRIINLEGKVLLPGFIDVHGHLTSRAGMMQAIDLLPEPYGTVNSIQDLQNTIKKYIKDHSVSKTQPIIGNGYDDAIMTEHRHPTKDELDAISKTNPIIVIHTSGHASVANTAMLNLLGISESSKDPEGGHYGRNKKTGKLNGKLEENASFTALLALTEKMSKEAGNSQDQAIKNLMKAQDEWLSYGQTTICDGRTMGETVGLLEKAAAEHLFKADIVYFPDYEYFKKDLNNFKPKYMRYGNHLKLGGFKFSDDGSPQGKTAWLTQPYLVPPEGSVCGL